MALDLTGGNSPVRRSAGVFVASFLDAAVAYDCVDERAHLLSRRAGWLLAEATGCTVNDLVAAAVGTIGLNPTIARDEARAGVEDLRRLGLLDRMMPVPTEPVVSPGVTEPRDGTIVGLTYPVLGERVAFRSSDPALLQAIDTFLGFGTEDRPETLVIDVDKSPGGEIELRTPDRWRFSRRSALFAQLPWILNQIAVRSTAMPVMHSGAVRTPHGEIIFVTGPSDAGKSTLVAGLVRAGCDYLGDEAIGVAAGSLHAVGYPKPLTLHAAACSYLGFRAPESGHVGPERLRSRSRRLVATSRPVDRIFLVSRRPEPVFDVARLDRSAALAALLSNTMNIARAGELGLRTLCDLAESVPVIEVVHPDARECASALIDRSGPLGGAVEAAGATSASTGMLHRSAVLTPSPINQKRPARAPDVDFASVDVDGTPMTIVRRGARAATVLSPEEAELWGRLDGDTAISDLVSSPTVAPDDLAGRWRQVTAGIERMVAAGLLVDTGSEGGRPENGALSVAPPAGDRSATLDAAGSPAPHHATGRSSRPLPDGLRPWFKAATVVAVGDVLVASDHPELRPALLRATTAGRATAADDRALLMGRTGRFVGLRTLPVPDAGFDLWVDGDVVWVDPARGVEAFATALLSALGEQLPDGIAPLRPAWIAEHGARVAVLIGGERPGSMLGAGRWRRNVGLHVEGGDKVWIVDERNAIAWVLAGLPPAAGRNLWTSHRFVVGVADSPDQADAWRRLADAVRADPGARGVLGRAITEATPAPVHGGGPGGVTRRLEAQIGLRSRHTELVTDARSGRPAVRLSETRAERSPFLDTWASLGVAGAGPESVRFRPQSVEVGRPLIMLDPGPGSSGAGADRDERLVRERLTVAFAAFGLDDDEARAAAGIASAGARLLVREDVHPDGSWRRKVYLGGAISGRWRRAVAGWPGTVAASSGSATWLSWKAVSARPTEVARAVEVARLNGASTVTDGISPVLDSMPAPWRSALGALVEWAGVDGSDEPGPNHGMLLHSDGRTAVDLPIGGRAGTCPPWSFNGVIRSLTASAGCDNSAAEEVAEWMSGRSATKVIFGVDSGGCPSVILYWGPRTASAS